MKKTTFGTQVAGIFAGVMLSASSMAATTLNVGTWLPASSAQNSVVWPTWAKWVEEATEGRVKVKLEYDLGHPKSMFNLVEDGVIDASFSVNGYLPGRFRLTTLCEIPGITPDAEQGSVALWKTYKEYLEPAGEFNGLKVLGMFVHGPGQLHTTFPVNSLSDLESRKIRVGGGIVNELASRLEVTPVSAPATKVYEMMQQGVVEGVFLPAMEQKYLRLNEVTSHLTLFPGGMYNTAFTIFMNPDVFDGLSDEDQQAIMSVSGEKLSRLAGQAWAGADQSGLEAAIQNGVEVNQLSEGDTLVEELHEAAVGMDQQWLDSVADMPVDAAAALEYYRSQVSQ